jgi:hypothetical protein
MLRMWLAELIAHFTGFAYAAGNKGAAIGGLHAWRALLAINFCRASGLVHARRLRAVSISPKKRRTCVRLGASLVPIAISWPSPQVLALQLL